MTVFDLPGKKEKIKQLEKVSSEESFWQDQEKAQKVMQELDGLRDGVKKIGQINAELDNLVELAEIAIGDVKIQKEIGKKIEDIGKTLKKLEFETLFSGEYDQNNAILSIHSGTGGTDAQDWAEMLLPMYLRYIERKGWKAKIISETRGHEAGIKSATLEIIGKLAYGYLKTDAGIHRLEIGRAHV